MSDRINELLRDITEILGIINQLKVETISIHDILGGCSDPSLYLNINDVNTLQWHKLFGTLNKKALNFSIKLEEEKNELDS
jgi:hypothetical protein